MSENVKKYNRRHDSYGNEMYMGKGEAGIYLDMKQKKTLRKK